MTRMKIIYVAGPYRASNAWGVESNIRCAEEIGFQIAGLGAVPVIPHTMYRFFNGTLTDRFWLDATLALMRTCDAMFLVPGWRNSEGSVAENENFAGPVFENFGDVVAWLERCREAAPR